MHRVKLVGLDLDASVRQFTLDRDRLEAALRKLRRQRLFVDAGHWSAMSWVSHVLTHGFHRASYRRQAPLLNGERTRSRYEPGAAPCVFLPAAIRGYAFRGSAAPRHVRLRRRLWRGERA